MGQYCNGKIFIFYNYADYKQKGNFFSRNIVIRYGIFSRQNITSTDCIKYEFSSPNDINVGYSSEQV